jgi:small-conductance mechanosensitive channel
MTNKRIFFLALLAILLLPVTVFAQQITIKSMSEGIANAVWVIATVVVIVIWVTTGILFLSAFGAPEKLKKAKIALFSAIAGTVLVILAYGAIDLVKNILGA